MSKTSASTGPVGRRPDLPAAAGGAPLNARRWPGDRLLGEILHADRFLTGERVADGDGDHPVLAVDGRTGGQVGLADNQPVDQYVDLTGA